MELFNIEEFKKYWFALKNWLREYVWEAEIDVLKEKIKSTLFFGFKSILFLIIGIFTLGYYWSFSSGVYYAKRKFIGQGLVQKYSLLKSIKSLIKNMVTPDVKNYHRKGVDGIIKHLLWLFFVFIVQILVLCFTAFHSITFQIGYYWVKFRLPSLKIEKDYGFKKGVTIDSKNTK